MSAPVEAPTPRELWRAVEGVHAVVYFSREVDDAVAAAGVTGWWRGYTAGRAAPMGAVGPAVVTATFATFAPSMVARNLPSAWAMASPDEVLAARLRGVVAAYGRLDGEDGSVGRGLASVVDVLDAAADAVPTLARPLAAAWAAHRSDVLAARLDTVGGDGAAADPASVVVRAWLAATVVREHRGDAHVAALAAAGLDGCEAHLTLSGTGRVPADVLRGARGWTDDDWAAATDRLRRRGLLDDRGRLTPTGQAVRAEVEAATDEAAAGPWSAVAAADRCHLVAVLGPIGRLVAERLPIRVPNPMGWEPLTS